MKYLKFLLFMLFIMQIGCINNSKSVLNKDIKDQLLVNLEGDTLKLSEIIMHKNLIFRYSILNCQSCIDSVFYQMKEFDDKIGRDNILIFTYFREVRHFIVSARLNQIKYGIFQVPKNQLLIKEDSLGKPFFFTIDKDLTVKDVFYIYDYHNQVKAIDKYLSKQVNIFHRSVHPTDEILVSKDSL